MKAPLVIGTQSMIGSALFARLQQKGLPVEGTSRRPGSPFVKLDFTTDPQSWAPLPAADVAFLCAAVAKLDTCKSDPAGTHLINVERMRELATRLQRQNTFIVFLSTNHVFNGRKAFVPATEAYSPVNDYGKQKAEFEQWLRESPYPSAILRLSKVVGDALPQIAKWQPLLEQNQPIEAFNDLGFAPLPLASVLDALEKIGTDKKPGIYQLSGSKEISYFDVARALAKKLGRDPKLVKEVSALAAGIPPEFLPRHHTLDRSTLPRIRVPEPLEVLGLI